jgi:hypothetical protein
VWYRYLKIVKERLSKAVSACSSLKHDRQSQLTSQSISSNGALLDQLVSNADEKLGEFIDLSHIVEEIEYDLQHGGPNVVSRQYFQLCRRHNNSPGDMGTNINTESLNDKAEQIEMLLSRMQSKLFEDTELPPNLSSQAHRLDDFESSYASPLSSEESSSLPPLTSINFAENICVFASRAKMGVCSDCYSQGNSVRYCRVDLRHDGPNWNFRKGKHVIERWPLTEDMISTIAKLSDYCEAAGCAIATRHDAGLADTSITGDWASRVDSAEDTGSASSAASGVPNKITSLNYSGNYCTFANCVRLAVCVDCKSGNRTLKQCRVDMSHVAHNWNYRPGHQLPTNWKLVLADRTVKDVIVRMCDYCEENNCDVATRPDIGLLDAPADAEARRERPGNKITSLNFAGNYCTFSNRAKLAVCIDCKVNNRSIKWCRVDMRHADANWIVNKHPRSSKDTWELTDEVLDVVNRMYEFCERSGNEVAFRQDIGLFDDQAESDVPVARERSFETSKITSVNYAKDFCFFGNNQKMMVCSDCHLERRSIRYCRAEQRHQGSNWNYKTGTQLTTSWVLSKDMINTLVRLYEYCESNELESATRTEAGLFDNESASKISEKIATVNTQANTCTFSNNMKLGVCYDCKSKDHSLKQCRLQLRHETCNWNYKHGSQSQQNWALTSENRRMLTKLLHYCETNNVAIVSRAEFESMEAESGDVDDAASTDSSGDSNDSSQVMAITFIVNGRDQETLHLSSKRKADMLDDEVPPAGIAKIRSSEHQPLFARSSSSRAYEDPPHASMESSSSAVPGTFRQPSSDSRARPVRHRPALQKDDDFVYDMSALIKRSKASSSAARDHNDEETENNANPDGESVPAPASRSGLQSVEFPAVVSRRKAVFHLGEVFAAVFKEYPDTLNTGDSAVAASPSSNPDVFYKQQLCGWAETFAADESVFERLSYLAPFAAQGQSSSSASSSVQESSDALSALFMKIRNYAMLRSRLVPSYCATVLEATKTSSPLNQLLYDNEVEFSSLRL